MPSKEHDASSVVSLRLPDALLERLHHYLDWMEFRRGEKLSRNQVIRLSLTQWLDTEEEQGGMTHPDMLRRHFHAVYNSLRGGQDKVEIHRLRHLLKWPPDRFDGMVEQLRSESQVALHSRFAHFEIQFGELLRIDPKGSTSTPGEGKIVHVITNLSPSYMRSV